MFDFSKNSPFDLKKVSDKQLSDEAKSLFIPGEILIGVYQTLRDQVVFTNKRIMTIDVQGVTGKKKDLCTLPYSKVQYFGVQTPGFVELISDSELILVFANDQKVVFEFRGQSDILEIGKAISQFVLS